jgi:dienelactone hydrolase
MRWTWLGLAIGLLATAGCIGATDDADPTAENLDPASMDEDETTPDPTAPGDHEVERSLFDFGYATITDVDGAQTYPAKLNGSIHYPESGGGPFPLVVFMHGRHTTCRVADDTTRVLGTQVCPNAPPAVEPVDSWKGYRYIAETLSSRGYVVASINANDVNDRDLASLDGGVEARAQLTIAAIDAFERAKRGEDPSEQSVAGQDPVGSDGLEEVLEDRIDTDRIGLMGHSRGGEGVVRAITYDRDVNDGEHDIDAAFAMAPIDFTDQTPTGVDLAVLLPYCDGDVFDLQGAHIFDRTRYADREPSAFQVQITALGANHNFYNTVWTGDFDDAGGYDGPFCGVFRDDGGGGRLSPEDQRRHGEALVNAFFETSLDNQTAYRDWFNRQASAPTSACPDGQAPCPKWLQTTYPPPEADALVIEDGTDATAPTTNELGGTIDATGFTSVTTCKPSDCPGWNVQGTRSLTLNWDDPARYTLTIPDAYRDVADYDALTVRAGVNGPDADGLNATVDFTVQVTDESGTSAGVAAGNHTSTLFAPPGEENVAKLTLDQVTLPLDAFAERGVDLASVESVSFAFDGTPSGSVQLGDVMLQR